MGKMKAPAAGAALVAARETVSEERARLRGLFDKACIEAAELGERLSPDSIEIGHEIGLDEGAIEAHRRRMLRVVEQRRIAGTQADREQDAAAAKAAREKASKDIAAIRRDIEALEGKIGALEEAAFEAEERCRRRSVAVQELRDLAAGVPWRNEEYHRARDAVQRRFSDLPVLKARLKLIAKLEDVVDPDQIHHHAHAAARDPDRSPAQRAAAQAVADVKRHEQQLSRGHPAWMAYLETVRAEGKGLRSRVETLSAEYDEALRSCDALFDSYLY